MMVVCPDFLSLDINDLSKGKELAKMVRGGNLDATLLILELAGGGPKLLMDRTLLEEYTRCCEEESYIRPCVEIICVM